MRETEEKGGTRGNMLHLIVLEYSCSLKMKNKAIETGKDRKKQEKAGNSRLLLKMFFLSLAFCGANASHHRISTVV